MGPGGPCVAPLAVRLARGVPATPAFVKLGTSAVGAGISAGGVESGECGVGTLRAHSLVGVLGSSLLAEEFNGHEGHPDADGLRCDHRNSAGSRVGTAWSRTGKASPQPPPRELCLRALRGRCPAALSQCKAGPRQSRAVSAREPIPAFPGLQGVSAAETCGVSRST